MESKKGIRESVLAVRKCLSEKEWIEKSCLIFQTVISHPFFLNSDEIYCYMDYRNEVETKRIIEAAWQMGKKVAVPKVFGDVMEFFYIENFTELHPGTFNILEPEENTPANGKNALVLMPGAVFDKNRNRIGYGRGYYDRYLKQHPKYKTMALAFEFQVLEKIPSEAHDIRPQIIVTEENVYV